MPLHPIGRLDARQTQHGGGEVDKTDQPIELAAGRDIRGREWPNASGMNTTRGTCKPLVVRPALAARHARAVVRKIENDRVVGEARGLDSSRRSPASASAALMPS